MKNSTFLKDFNYDLPNIISSYKTIAKYYLTKALKKFFINTNIYILKISKYLVLFLELNMKIIQ